jgi:hypothetical protein
MAQSPPAVSDIPPPDECTKPQGKKWSMAVINFWLDTCLFLAVVALVWVTVVMVVVFPAPTQAAGWQLWGLGYDQWHNVQVGALFVAVALAVEHLVLHWNWVCTIIATKIVRTKSRPDEGLQAIYGVGTFIAIAGTMLVSLLVALFSVTRG